MSVSVRLVRLKSAPKSTEIFYGKSLLDRALQPMTFNTMSLPAYRDSLISSLSGGMGGGEFSAIVMSPLVGIMGLCLISLLVLGGLWLKSRFLDSGLHRARYTETHPEPSSTYDYVTGLPTRRLFGTLLEQAVGRAAKTGRSLAVLVVELEHFRMVAETQGRANGNVLVRVQAARVKGVVRSTETVARLAQDQFALILDSFTSHEEVVAIVEKLQATIGLPLTLEGQELFLTCRIGVALYPQDATEYERLITQAVQAVKQAKSDGQAVQFTSPIVSSAASESAARVSVHTEQEARHS
ncbi:MAG: GGDEF domain-containing protein [Nitrospirota bacterium]